MILADTLFNDVKEFLDPIGSISSILATLLIVFGGFFRGAISIYKRVFHNLAKKELFPIYSDGDIRQATQYYVPTWCQNIPASYEYELGDTQAFVVREKLMRFFLKKAFPKDLDNCRFYFIMGDSGMGKTTFLINLYLTYSNPLYKRPYKIALFPLNNDNLEDLINAIPLAERKKTILLLDAFDENPSAIKDHKKKLEELLELVKEFREVVFTCRTQFFPNELEEPHETKIIKSGPSKGYHKIKKIYISPFSDSDVKKYLRKKYGTFNPWNLGKKRRAKEIVKASPSLMVRPMLLSYIDDLLSMSIRFNYRYLIYEALISKWIEREVNREVPDKRERVREELYAFSKEIAMLIYSNWTNGRALFIMPEEIKNIATKNNISLSHLELKSRSLLNRDAEGRYKFSHKSILEYFLAIEIFENEDFETQFDFNGMDQAYYFFSEMCFEKICIPYFLSNNVNSSPTKSSIDGLIEMKALSISTDNFNARYVVGLRNLKKLEIILPNGEQLIEIKGKNGFAIYDYIRKITKLRINNCSLSSITFLKHFIGIETINLANNNISNVSGLLGLSKLSHINLEGNTISKTSIANLKSHLKNCTVKI